MDKGLQIEKMIFECEKAELLCLVPPCFMGSSVSLWTSRSKYRESRTRHGVQSGLVVATSDFDPEDIQWPESWGLPLPLKKSMAIRVISDDGGDRAFGHYVGQPERRGYFLKHLTEKLETQRPPPHASWLEDHAQQSPLRPKFRESPSEASTSLPSLSPSPSVPSDLFVPTSPNWPHPSLNATPPRHPRQGFWDGSRNSAPSPGFSHLPHLQSKFHPYPVESQQMAIEHPVSAFRSLASPVRVNPMAANLSQLRGDREVGHFSEVGRRGTSVANSKSLLSQNMAGELRQTSNPLAAELGLHETEEHLLWLVDAAAAVELPAGWMTFDDDEGRAVYYHEKKRYVTRKHPMLQRFRVYAEQLQKFYGTLSAKNLNSSTKIRAHLAVVLNEVLNRCHRELPAMTPVLLERTAVLVGIDTTSEFELSTKAPCLCQGLVMYSVL